MFLLGRKVDIKNAIGSLVAGVVNRLTRILLVLSRRLQPDRGDVPGWVLVTVMTAGLVTGLWMIADDQLTALLTKAINSVSK
ncbi:MAG: hypothetical protein V9E85_05205 [Candidatus Nanopelagicales bacterium]|jgi:hypothetical protein